MEEPLLYLSIYLEEDALQLPDGDVVDGARAELAAELFGGEAAEVVDVVGPQVEDVVAREPVPLLHHDDPGAQELRLDGGAEAAGAGADDEDALAGADAAALVHLVAGTLVELKIIFRVCELS